MKPLTPSEHKTLAVLAPTREVYGKPPLPIEILAAGGPKALERQEWAVMGRSGLLGRNLTLDEAEGLARVSGGTVVPTPALREWLRKGKA